MTVLYMTYTMFRRRNVNNVEGRAITLEMPAFYLVNVYVPTSQDVFRKAINQDLFKLQ